MKIVLTGPESVGKSILTKQLAEYYKGIYVEEYARYYIESLKETYGYRDVLHIAKHQFKEYDNLDKIEGFCFFDTYLIITKIWFLLVFNKIPIWFEEEFKKRPVDLYLLCKDDIDWQPDGVRENKNIRSLLFEKYKQELDNYGFNYSIISGKGRERLTNAIDSINNFVNKTII